MLPTNKRTTFPLEHASWSSQVKQCTRLINAAARVRHCVQQEEEQLQALLIARDKNNLNVLE